MSNIFVGVAQFLSIKSGSLSEYQMAHFSIAFYIRRHKATQKGDGWSARIYAISSCEEGKCAKDLLEDKNIPETLKTIFRKKRRERLHIHLLIAGEPGSTIAEYITRYWEVRFGLVSKKKFGFDDVNWLEEYFGSQILAKRRLAV